MKYVDRVLVVGVTVCVLGMLAASVAQAYYYDLFWWLHRG